MTSYYTEHQLDFTHRDGFEYVYRRYVGKMIAICIKGIDDEEAAKEIVQDVFKRLWEHRHHIVITGSLENYLMRAAKLEIIDFYRKRQRLKMHHHNISQLQQEADHTTEQQINLRELQLRIKLSVDRLSHQCKNVFMLSRESGMTNQEIATRLGISHKTVEAHMTKAIAYLRKSIEKE